MDLLGPSLVISSRTIITPQEMRMLLASIFHIGPQIPEYPDVRPMKSSDLGSQNPKSKQNEACSDVFG